MPRLSISGLLNPPCLGAAVLLALAGCDAQIGSFRTNDVVALSLASTRSTPMDTAKRDVSILLTDWFGTPSQPKWPSQFVGDELNSVVQLDRLMQASGGVKSGQEGEHTGLYREHCVVCHSLEGSGAGPASMYQDPYPRDFRAGVFKWKSTKRASPPTRDDLRAVLKHGIPGTAMPSFAGIPEDEMESLIDYVIYLSIRGELEQELLAASVDEFGYGDSAPTEARFRFTVADTINNNEAIEFAAQTLREICNAWVGADENVVVVPDAVVNATISGAELLSSIQRGRDLFHGPIANCVGCHGPAGGGGATILDYDDWTKAYSSRLGLTPSDAEAMRPMVKAGALPPRLADPRNLKLGVFRGGSETPALYRRISQGIAGTPMPGVEITTEASLKSLSPDQVLDLIHYVRSLGGELGAAPPSAGG
jgi:mono/diheme cytochrome c family protein